MEPALTSHSRSSQEHDTGAPSDGVDPDPSVVVVLTTFVEVEVMVPVSWTSSPTAVVTIDRFHPSAGSLDVS